jgi:hypothetical protein
MGPTKIPTSCWIASARSVALGARPTWKAADREKMIRDVVDAHYYKPVRIVAFNTTEGWARDVTVDIADELRRRYPEFGEIPDSILDFIQANRR